MPRGEIRPEMKYSFDSDIAAVAKEDLVDHASECNGKKIVNLDQGVAGLVSSIDKEDGKARNWISHPVSRPRLCRYIEKKSRGS